MMPVVSLVQALSRLDPSELSLRNDADDLEVVAHGVSLGDPTLPAGSSAALDALRAVLDEALSTGCAHVEFAVQEVLSSSARWRRSLAGPPTVTEIESFARGPSVRVRLRESFGLGVMRDAVHRRTPERDALLQAMVSPRVPVRDLRAPVRPLASAALSSVRPPLRGALELRPPGTSPTLVRCIEGYAWQEEPLWSELAHRPPVRIWIDARWPSDFDALPPLRALPLAAEWRALSDDARVRFNDWLFRGTWEGSSSSTHGSDGWAALRHALQELLATAVMRSGRLSLQSAPLTREREAPHDAGDRWFPAADDVRPLLDMFLFDQRGFDERSGAVHNHHITLAGLAEIAATTTDPVQLVDHQTDGDRGTKSIKAHLSSPAVHALMTPLQAQADASYHQHRTALEAWRGDATPVATLTLVRRREELPGTMAVVAVAPAEGERPVEITVHRGGAASAPRAYGPPLARPRAGLAAWRILVRVGDDAALTDAEAVVLALRRVADQLIDDARILGVVEGGTDPAFVHQLRSHLAGVAFALDPAGVLDMGNERPSAEDEAGLRAWVGPRPGSAFSSRIRVNFNEWTMPFFQGPSGRPGAGPDALFRVALATLRAEGVAGSESVDADAPWAVLVSPERGARVVSLRDWCFDGWAVARDDGPADSARWKHHLAQQLGWLVRWMTKCHSDTAPELWWQCWLTLAAASRQVSAPKVEEVLAEIEAEPFVRMLDASNCERTTSLATLALSKEKVRGWWWRELAPGERWREEEGVFLREGELTDEVVRGLGEHLGVVLTKGEVEAAAAGAGPTHWRIGIDNVRALLALAASPELDRLSGELREALRHWLCFDTATVQEMREAVRAAKIWPTTEGAYVSAMEFPPGEAPSVEYRGDRHSARHPGRAPCIVVKVSEKDHLDVRYNTATCVDEYQQELHLSNNTDIALLNDVFSPMEAVPQCAVINVYDD